MFTCVLWHFGIFMDLYIYRSMVIFVPSEPVWPSGEALGW